uniref:C-type lectin domain-containing protein n=1 Tax=Acrobeloides nanus TaxID=290746 RepID=A0A914EJ27_9BILA
MRVCNNGNYCMRAYGKINGQDSWFSGCVKYESVSNLCANFPGCAQTKSNNALYPTDYTTCCCNKDLCNDASLQTCSCPAGNWYQSTITGSCKCYNFIQTPKDWQSSNNDCRQQNPKATLGSIDSAFENNEILNVLKNQTSCSQVFIGLKQSSNSWSWINNDTSTYQNWRSGYPSSNSNNIYSQLNTADGKWTNIDGTAQGCYVCEIKA